MKSGTSHRRQEGNGHFESQQIKLKYDVIDLIPLELAPKFSDAYVS